LLARGGERQMRSDGRKQGEKSPCSVKNAPMPEAVSCPRCAGTVEVWTDEEEATCGNCGQEVYRRTVSRTQEE
jgi:transcription elongation factor Elf1